MAELKFTITEHIGVLSENAKGWTKEDIDALRALLNGEELEDDIDESSIL